ncbi:MAG: BatA domain-containing protein, partial [Aestuariivirga sp.]|nr:BatA domain-containing protein [Aestuariivirga sp.]
MNFLSALSFTTPLALAALLLLPVIWWLLRFTPPRPETVRFPPIRLLLGLVSREEQPDKTPWWLLLLRLLAAALLILAVAHPLYAPGRVGTLSGTPLLLVVDDSWAAARDWDKRGEVMDEILDGAAAAGAPVTLATTTPQLRPQSLEPQAAADAATRAQALVPRAIDPDREALLAALTTRFANQAAPRVIWLTDGIDDGKARAFAEGLTRLGTGGASVEAIVPEASALPLALANPGFTGGQIKVTALRAPGGPEQVARVSARAGNGRSFGEAELKFAAGATRAEGAIELPVELRNEVGRLSIEGERNAAATFLMDDRWRRKTVGLMSGTSAETAQPLLSPLYFASRALEPYGEISEPADTAALKNLLDQG